MVKVKKRKLRVRGKPKKPLTAFLLYVQVRRNIVKLNNPHMTIAEITTEIGKEWRQLSEEEKEPYVQLYKEAKKKYDEALEVFYSETK